MKRVFLIVLDSLGIGAMPDAADFGDVGANTLKRISASAEFSVPNLEKMGLGAIDGVDYLGNSRRHTAAVARVSELGCGKDTTAGHWELAGLVSERPMPTYPFGFPSEIIEEFEKRIGRGVLCNKPYSGTVVISEYGEEHMRTGKPIVYTSADSVFQIAAHEEVIPLETLYEYCRIAREILVGEHAVGRVIARPFVGKAGGFTRTANRRDFSVVPPEETLLDKIKGAGMSVISVGKISDIFAARGITESHPTHSNREGIEKTLELLERDFTGLCFVNLVDFDMLYGHRQDVDGYARALSEFDAALPSLISGMRRGDLLIITADHGCDPGDDSTDHTREYVPLLVCGEGVRPEDLGTLRGFTAVGRLVADYLGCEFTDAPSEKIYDKVFGEKNMSDKELLELAASARQASYCPYSGISVGAALLCRDGRVFTGANIENASFSPTVCAERVALFSAVHEGEREFEAIAIVGGKVGKLPTKLFAPCGVCRQALSEFASGDLRVIMTDGVSVKVMTLDGLLPLGFGSDSF